MGQGVERPAVIAEMDLEAPLSHGEPDLDPARSRGALGIAIIDGIGEQLFEDDQQPRPFRLGQTHDFGQILPQSRRAGRVPRYHCAGRARLSSIQIVRSSPSKAAITSTLCPSRLISSKRTVSPYDCFDHPVVEDRLVVKQDEALDPRRLRQLDRDHIARMPPILLDRHCIRQRIHRVEDQQVGVSVEMHKRVRFVEHRNTYARNRWNIRSPCRPVKTDNRKDSPV